MTTEQALAVEQTLLSEKAEIHVDPPNSEMPAQSSGESQNEEKEDVVLTFAELQELITAGRVDSIPNNKIIPGGLNVRCSLCVSSYTYRHPGRATKHVHSYSQKEAMGGCCFGIYGQSEHGLGYCSILYFELAQTNSLYARTNKLDYTLILSKTTTQCIVLSMNNIRKR